MSTAEYELMRVMNMSDGAMYSGDIDTEPATHGNAMDVIRFLLEFDLSIAGYKLVKSKR